MLYNHYKVHKWISLDRERGRYKWLKVVPVKYNTFLLAFSHHSIHEEGIYFVYFVTSPHAGIKFKKLSKLHNKRVNTIHGCG